MFILGCNIRVDNMLQVCKLIWLSISMLVSSVVNSQNYLVERLYDASQYCLYYRAHVHVDMGITYVRLRNLSRLRLEISCVLDEAHVYIIKSESLRS